MNIEQRLRRIEEAVSSNTKSRINEDELDFYMVPKDIIQNKLYPLVKNVKSFYDSVNNGEDFDVEWFDQIIKRFQFIRGQVVHFNSEEEYNKANFK